MHGWLNLDKPIGISSARAIWYVKRIIGANKIGHCGTLDPLASGVLPIAIGEATKVTSYVSEKLKKYSFNIQWGEQRTTDDFEGEVILRSSIKPSVEQINKAIGNFIGYIEQVPPIFSAINVSGVRSYKLARNNKNISLKSRLVYVKDLTLIAINIKENNAKFSLTCGKGLYVRSIARDLGIFLKCLGYVSYLRREKVGEFMEKNSITLEELEDQKEGGNMSKVIHPLSVVLERMFNINILCQEAKKIKNGQNIVLNNLYMKKNYDICYARMGDVPVAMCSIRDGIMKPIRVFNV